MPPRCCASVEVSTHTLLAVHYATRRVILQVPAIAGPWPEHLRDDDAPQGEGSVRTLLGARVRPRMRPCACVIRCATPHATHLRAVLRVFSGRSNRPRVSRACCCARLRAVLDT